MSNNRFRDAVGQIDDRLLERCEAYEQRLMQKKRRMIWSAVAAAACFAVIIGVLLSALPDSRPKGTIALSAKDIAAIFPGEGGGLNIATDEYQTVYVRNENDLRLNSIPEMNYLPIYQCARPNGTFSEESIRAFADSFFPALAQTLGGAVPQYTVGKYRNRMDIDTPIGEHGVSVSQDGYLNYLCISRFLWRSGKATTTSLNGQIVQVDQTKTDQEIIESLSDIHQLLQDLFGVDFPDAKVVRMYDEESDHGAVVLQVFFYDKDAHPLNEYSQSPVSDHIQLWFYNHPGFMEEQLSHDVLQYVDIMYRDWRTDTADMYTEIGTAAGISLQEAKQLLKKGYTFGGHHCLLCRPNQDSVDFTDYDYVSFIYLWNQNEVSAGKQAACIPFYVFYKRIDTADNGNEVYAKTYVPAVDVSGLGEYFKSKHVGS